jgi:hypothetical protein
MVGSKSEQGGIIKDGAKMVNASNLWFLNSRLSWVTLRCWKLCVCGKAYDPRLILPGQELCCKAEHKLPKY